MKVTKDDLAHELRQINNLDKPVASYISVINDLLITINTHLLAGDTIEIRGFGTFKPVIRKGRLGRNPKTGEPVTYPDKKKVIFNWALKDK